MNVFGSSVCCDCAHILHCLWMNMSDWSFIFYYGDSKTRNGIYINQNQGNEKTKG